MLHQNSRLPIFFYVFLCLSSLSIMPLWGQSSLVPDINAGLPMHANVDPQGASTLTRSNGTHQVVIDFEGIGQAGIFPADFFAAQGIFLQPGRLAGGETASSCFHEGLGSGYYLDGSVTIDIPAGITELSHMYAAAGVQPGCSGLYRSGVRIYSGPNGTGSLLASYDFTGHQNNSQSDGGCDYNVWYNTGSITWGSTPAFSVVFWEDAYPCPTGTYPYSFTGLDLIAFTVLSPENDFILSYDDTYINLEVNEGEYAEFEVRLAEPLSSGQTVEVEIVETGQFAGTTVLNIPQNTYTFTSGNSTSPWTVTVFADENDNFDNDNDKSTFEVRLVDSNFGVAIDPVEIPVEEIDDDFTLDIPFVTLPGQELEGGTITPIVVTEHFDIDLPQSWTFPIIATPDPGYEIIDWHVSFTGTIANPDGSVGQREPFLQLSEPEVLSDGSVRRLIESVTLSPDFSNGFGIQPIFSNIPAVSVTLRLGSGSGTLDPEGTFEWEPGRTYDISASPEPGFVFDRWEVVSGTVAIGSLTDPTTTLVADTACVVEAHFEPSANAVTLSLGSDPSQGGTTAPAGNLSLLPGQEATITAIANDGWSFLRWESSGSLSYLVGNQTTEQVTVQIFSNSQLTAVFGQGENFLTVVANPTNGGAVSPTEPIALQPSQEINVSATPFSGWQFNGWQVSDTVIFVSGDADSESPRVRITGNATMTALFSEIGQEGQVVVSPYGVTVDEGGSPRTFNIFMDGPPSDVITANLRWRTGQNARIEVNGDSSINTTFHFYPNDFSTVHAFEVRALPDSNERNGYSELRLVLSGNHMTTEVFDIRLEENDVDGRPRIQITPSELNVSEGVFSCNEGKFFTISLPEEPENGSKTVWLEHDSGELFGIYGCNGTTVSGRTITFNSQNWQSGLTVAVENEPGQREDIEGFFYVSSGSPNGQYDDSRIVKVNFINDPQGDNARLTTANTNLSIPEGEQIQVELTLLDPPPEQIRFDVNGNTSDFQPSTTSLYFSSSNPTRTLTITSAEDDDDLPDTGTLRLRYVGFDYDYIEDLVLNLTEEDNDATRPVVLAVPNQVVMEAGLTSEVMISLSNPPDQTTILALGTTDGDGNPGLSVLTPGNSLLTFTPGNYNQPQPVTIFASAEGSGTLDVSLGSGDPRTEGANVPVTVTQPSITIQTNVTGLGFGSNSAQNFQVWLSHPPPEPVTLEVTAQATSGFPGLEIADPDPPILTFDASNFDQRQSVRVTASNVGQGEVTVAWVSGEPPLTPVVLPVNVSNASCTGQVTVIPSQISVFEGERRYLRITQTNSFHYNRPVEIVQTSGPEGLVVFDETSLSVPDNEEVLVGFDVMADSNTSDEVLRFSVRVPSPNSPPCTPTPDTLIITVQDLDYLLTLQLNPDNGQVTTVPPPGDSVFVDGQVYTDTPFPLAAGGIENWVFDSWSGDIHLLTSLPGSDALSPDVDPFAAVINNSLDPQEQVNLTANFRQIEPEVDEAVDAIVDQLLDTLIAQCGLGGADFSEYGLESGNQTGAMDGGRILPHSGQELRDETDLSLPGLDHPTQINITRRHLTRVNAERSPFGPAWHFNYRVYFTRNEEGDLLIHNLGRVDVFQRDEVLAEVWHGTGGRFERITRYSPGAMIMRAPSGVKWMFQSIRDANDPLFKGVLHKIISPNGNEIRFEYENVAIPLLDRRMTRIVDAFGREIEFVYGSDGNSPYVTAIRDHTDPDAVREWQYTYDAGGRLTSVRTPTVTSTDGFNDFPDGKRTDYRYRQHADPRLSHALTGIIFPNQTSKGQTFERLSWTYYDEDVNDPLFGYVETHTMGDPTAPFPLRSGGDFSYSYQPMEHDGGIGEVSMCTTVTDRAGARTVLDYNRRGLLLEERIENPDAALNKNAPSHFVRSFQFNDNGDLISAKTPIQQSGGDPSAYTEEHPDLATTPRYLQRQERRKVVAVDFRGGDQEALITETVYEPIFNKIFKTVDPRGLGDNPEFLPEEVTTYQFYDYMENLSAAITRYAPELGLSESELTDLLLDAGIPQAIQAKWNVDPLAGAVIDINGDNLSHQDYCGNLIRREHPDTILPQESQTIGMKPLQSAFELFEYNVYGQMTRHIDAEGNHTVWEFFPDTDPNGWNGSAGSGAYNAGGGFLARKVDDAEHEAGANSGSGATPVQRTTDYAYVAQNRFPRNPRGVATTLTDGRGVVSRRFVNELDQITIHQSAWQVPEGDPDLVNLRYQQRTHFDANDNVDRTSVNNVGSLNTPGSFLYNATIYDILDQPVRQVQDSANQGFALTTENVYDNNQNLIQQTTAVGTADEAVQTWQYDKRDLLVSTTKGVTGDPTIGEVATITHLYDDNGNRIQTIDADGDVSFFHYDGFDRLFRTVDRVGNVTRTFYDAASNKVSVEQYGPTGHSLDEVLLGKTEQKYDARGRAYESIQHLFHYDGLSYGNIDPGANGNYLGANLALVRNEVVYDRLNRPVLTVDAEGDTSRTIYDGLGGAFRTIDPLGNSVVHLYDANHNLIQTNAREKDPSGNIDDELYITQFRYDAVNRRYQVIEPNGQTTTTQYDSRNNIVRVIDHLQNHTDFHYDTLSRPIGEIRYLSSSGENAGPDAYSDIIQLGKEWDAQNRLATQIDDAGNRTEYYYDDLGRKILTLYPEGHSESSVYNGDGERISAATMSGSLLSWDYDAAGRPLEMLVDHSGVSGDYAFEGTLRQRFAYDGLNRLIYSYDDNGQSNDVSLDGEVGIYTTFDSLGRPISEVQAFGDLEGRNPSENGKRIISQWQGAGRLESLTYPDGRIVTRGYDPLDRLQEVREGGSSLIAAFDYMGPGRDLEILYGNGAILEKQDPTAPTTLGFGYDANRRSLQHRWTDHSGTLITGYSDTYNGLNGVGTNRVIAQDREHLARGDQWTLDARYRMESFSRNDGALSSSRVLNGSDAMEGQFIDEGVHQAPIPDWKLHDYIYFNSSPRPHDENGNLRADGRFTYGYDFANRLSSVRHPSTGDLIARYSYSADNRRMGKEVWQVDGGGPPVEKMTGDYAVRYVYNGWQVLEERDHNDIVLRQYVDGRSLDDHLQMTDYTLSGDGSASSFYYHCNAQGFVGAITDESGSVVEYAEYSMLGKPSLLYSAGTPLALPQGVSSVGNAYLFQGRRYDPETGNYYFRNRYYDPYTGHFLTIDPSGRWHHGQGNGYSVFDADPWNNRDPMGLETLSSTDCDLLSLFLAMILNNPTFGDRYASLRHVVNPALGWSNVFDHLQLNDQLYNEVSISSPETYRAMAAMRFGHLNLFNKNPRADFMIGLVTSLSGWTLPGMDEYNRALARGENVTMPFLTADGRPPAAFDAGQLVGQLAMHASGLGINAMARAPGPGSVAPDIHTMQHHLNAIRSRNMTQSPPVIRHQGLNAPRINVMRNATFGERAVLRVQTFFYQVRNFFFR